VSAEFDELISILSETGVTVTFDSRRYARAATEWPDFMPPMLAQEAVKVERWGLTEETCQWVARKPEDWPTPTVAVGETWERKSVLLSWQQSEVATGITRSIKCVVTSLAGECWLDHHRNSQPMSCVTSAHWRRVEAQTCTTNQTNQG
jgi:hypothetical protein